MKYSFFSRIRDILFFCALLLLVKTAFERTASYIELHKDSMIHELDCNFINQIYTAQHQLHVLEQHPVYAHEYADTLTDIKKQLTTIEEKYKKNSPGLTLLGPIGSAAIVVKEKELEKQLLATINDLGKIFANITQQEQFASTPNINYALNNNKKVLSQLTYA